MTLIFKPVVMRLVLAAICLHGSATLADATGVYPDRVVVGQSAAFQGPAMALGLGMRQGLQAAFHEINEQGGVHGRRMELLTLDDGYEPNQAIANTRQLIEEDEVFALIGAVGTPTSSATLPLTKATDVPFIGPFTGAGFLRDARNTHVVNVRGSYDQETEAWIQHLTDDLDVKRIAILYQDDSFGRAGLSGVRKALDKRGLSLVAEGTYARNSVAVKTALLRIRKGQPEAVVMVGSYKPIATFIKLARKIRMDPLFVTISFVGSKALAAELGSSGEGVVVTQVVPSYENRTMPLVNQYHQALARADVSAEPGFVSLEGYLAGRVFIEALQRVGPSVSREKLIQQFQQSPVEFDIGNVILSYGPGDNQGMDQVYLSELQKDGSFRYVDKLSKAISTAELP